MKRSALYGMIWDRPLTKVAAELGISGVGLAKTCRRHDIPVPARGHWAKLAAGKPSPPIGLPYREVDTEVPVATSPRAGTKLGEGSVQAAVGKQLADGEGVKTSIPMSPTLERPHQLVRATAAYVRRIPALVARHRRRPIAEQFGRDVESPPFEQHGLYHLSQPGSLRLVASMAQMDWVLRFHDALFKALVHAGAKMVLVPADRNESERVAAEKLGERVFLSFRENYRRQEIDPDELARLHRENKWARSWRYVPSGKFTLAVAGTKYAMSAEWKATGEQLETKLPVIIETCLTLLRSQPTSRAARLEREEASRRSAEAAAKVRQRQAAQAKQLENAFEAAQTYRRVERLKSFLKIFELQIPTFNKPYDERAKVGLKSSRQSSSGKTRTTPCSRNASRQIPGGVGRRTGGQKRERHLATPARKKTRSLSLRLLRLNLQLSSQKHERETGSAKPLRRRIRAYPTPRPPRAILFEASATRAGHSAKGPGAVRPQ